MERFKHASGEIWNGDCMELMRHIPSGSVDMILCDLPYETTACKWDTVIPFEPLWAHYKRLIKPRGAIVLTASQPFTSALVMSNVKGFRHEWVWKKEKGTGFQIAKFRPLQEHESVLVFTKSGEPCSYNPIKTPREKIRKSKGATTKSESSPLANLSIQNYIYSDKFPTSILQFQRDKDKIHPTQKPVALFEYLIKTYTNAGDVVLDNCSGSGTTAIAAHRSGRRSLCIEQDLEYYLASCGRVWGEQNA